MLSCSPGRRRFRRDAARALSLGALAFAASACGGASVAERATAICSRDARALRAAPDYRHRVAVAQRELAELRALHAPRLDGLISALAREVDAADRLRVAATIGDSESAQGAYHQGQVAVRAAQAAARRAGVPACG